MDEVRRRKKNKHNYVCRCPDYVKNVYALEPALMILVFKYKLPHYTALHKLLSVEFVHSFTVFIFSSLYALCLYVCVFCRLIF